MENKEDELICTTEWDEVLTEYYESGKQIKRFPNGKVVEKILTEKDYYFPTEIPNRYPSKEHLETVDKCIRNSKFRIALANLYELIEKRWNGEKGLDKEIDRLRKVCKERVSWTIDLPNLPKIKPSFNN